MNLSHILAILAGAAQGDPQKFTRHMTMYDEPWADAVDLNLFDRNDL